MRRAVYRFGDFLYRYLYKVYYPLYIGYKVLSDATERHLFKQIIRPGSLVVDVGSNIGVHTKLFSKLVGKFGEVHSFEPDRLNFFRLQQNVGNSDNVTLNSSAVGEQTGVTNLFLSADLNVDHRTFDAGDGRSSVEVPIVSLDNYFSSRTKVNFIKIDVQGHELAVLKGARRVLKDNYEIQVLLEFWPYGMQQGAVTPSEIFDFFEEQGFDVYRVSKRGLRKFSQADNLDSSDPKAYCNLFITRGTVPSV